MTAENVKIIAALERNSSNIMAVISQLSSRRQTLCLTADRCSSPLEIKKEKKKKAKNIFYILYIHTSIHVLIIVIDFTHSA